VRFPIQPRRHTNDATQGLAAEDEASATPRIDAGWRARRVQIENWIRRKAGRRAQKDESPLQMGLQPPPCQAEPGAPTLPRSETLPWALAKARIGHPEAIGWYNLITPHYPKMTPGARPARYGGHLATPARHLHAN
jgi:hypothetical protein